ncbi:MULTISPECIES: succinate dehydrogenase, hydrophobic membrane anchor protein [unclassified Phenylobacterium]|uniref:succinate dehydrogenase, hydrophobic membrane anchor protein n=1 Tax=unclassified Phenylobacterium TaxID=2640670 RepID=UPI002264EC4D|nr:MULTISPECIES: succinate dehydrogenase, hydrophobic membrane anchor protein [unclassified Phenylobacterium]MBS0491118.1 succinate dehydrogenase, hydrophobic membrane anchor protein [Pseudomonadota bacterium]MCX7585869.1 succinate dehydrogenase, hydrophobic membrane anchor protein [Phenylobacterium sp. 58.2.17]WGU40580.1 succinate dehydrogenase, hydrophobic membrane anchor protein [Phenylobacterium sp. NIBR 498073]
MTTGPTLRTPRSRALGLGSAHHGVGHFIVEHVTAVMLVPLGLWGAWVAIQLAGQGYDAAAYWISKPVNAVLLAVLLVCALVHVKNAMQVVIEDYIGRFFSKAVLLLLNYSICVLAGALGVFAILKAAFSGAF